ncbi:unnamed protein product, partial [Mesorhabditis belari]|uniref:p-granule-associated protein DEPS-1 second OB-fold domain-containing protein n=1 Tax=Mesorhabditis belari TaxID=2138241 RepID=A0AAF3F224_9BILA
MEDVQEIDGCFYVMQFQRHSSAKMKAFKISTGGQFLVKGVMDEPENAQIYVGDYGILPLSMADVKRALPNIEIKVWVKLHEDFKNMCLTASFAEFEGVDEEDQYMVASAPWNSGKDKYALHVYSDSDDEGPTVLRTAKEDDNKRFPYMKRLDVHCIYTSHLNLYSECFKTDRIVFPFLKKDPLEIPAIGETLLCNIVWHQYETCFVVYEWRRATSERPIPTKKIGLFDAIEVGVKEMNEHPGIFKSEKFGFMDDPEKKLSMHHLTRYNNSVCRVYVKDDAPTKLGRFRIVDVETDKFDKIKKFLDMNKIEVNNEIGVIVSTDGKNVFSAKHASITFRFDQETCEDWRYLSPGTKIKFTANYNGKYGVMDIVSFATHSSLVPVNVVERGNSLWFNTKCIWDRNSFQNILISQDFGPIDDANEQFREKFRPNREYGIWVTRSMAVTTPFPISRTVYNVVWTGATLPNESESIEKPVVPANDGTKLNNPINRSQPRFSAPLSEPTPAIITDSSLAKEKPPTSSRFSAPSEQVHEAASVISKTAKHEPPQKKIDSNANSKKNDKPEKKAESEKRQSAPSTTSNRTTTSTPSLYSKFIVQNREALRNYGLLPSETDTIAQLLGRAADIIENQRCCGAAVCRDNCLVRTYLCELMKMHYASPGLRYDPAYERAAVIIASYF